MSSINFLIKACGYFSGTLMLLPLCLFLQDADTGKTGEMDNTTYQYTDHNANEYFFFISPAGSCIMEFVPAPIPATTGKRSSRVSVIPGTEYTYLLGILKVAVSEAGTSSASPASCRHTVTIITKKPRKYNIDCNTGSGKTLDNLVAGYKKKYMEPQPEKPGDLKPDKLTDTLLVRGMINEKPYESKKGIVTGVMEYYFIPNEKDRLQFKLEKEYFIKLWEGSVLKKDMTAHIGKEITVKAFFKKGLWDATDEQHASRYGDYIAVFAIITH